MICPSTVAQSKYSTFTIVNVTLFEVGELGGGDDY